MVSAPRSSQSGCFRSQRPPSLQTLVNSLLREGSTSNRFPYRQGDQLAPPFRTKVSRLSSRPARSCMRLCLDARANEQNRGSSARAAKAFRPANWSARRAASASERCSHALLEYRIYIRFAVTKQLKMGRAQFEFRPLTAGRAPPTPCYAWRKAASGLAE